MTTNLLLSCRLVERHLATARPRYEVTAPYPHTAILIARRDMHRAVGIGHDAEGWWVRAVGTGPALACASLYGALCHGINYLDEFDHWPDSSPMLHKGHTPCEPTP